LLVKPRSFCCSGKQTYCPSYGPACLDEGNGKGQLREGKGRDQTGFAVRDGYCGTGLRSHSSTRRKPLMATALQGVPDP